MVLSIDLSLYTIRHTQIGGTEFGIYSWVKGLAETDARLSVTYGLDADLSPEFLAWLGSRSDIEVVQRMGWRGAKALRFAQELAFENSRTGHDWAIYPNYFCPPGLYRKKRRRCVIVHDIQYRIFPQYHSAKRRAWLDFYMPKMFDWADRIILISESERDLVRKHFGPKAAERCDVVSNAVDWQRLQAPDIAELSTDISARISHPYILSVCHQFPHKNIVTLLKAFTEVAKTDREVRLYLVGKSSDANKAFINQTIPADIIDRVHVLGFVDDRTLGVYYANARLFALPSLYEGCGVPAVEALGFGVPTLVSRVFALPEATLGLAHYIDDPVDVGEWADRIRSLLRSGERPPLATVDRIRVTYEPKTIGLSMLSVLARRD